MIYERFVFLFAWSISTILISSEVSSTLASNQVSNYSLSKHIYLVKNTDVKQSNQAISRIPENRNLVVQQSESPSESPDVSAQDDFISKRWTGLGIVVTLTFFCLLLWILFQPNSQIKTTSNLAHQNDDKPDNKINSANDIQIEFEDEVEFEEEISLPPLFPLKEDNLSQNLSDEITVVQETHWIKEEQKNSSLAEHDPDLRDPNLTVSDDIQNPIIEPELVQIDAENQRDNIQNLIIEPELVQIDAENQRDNIQNLIIEPELVQIDAENQGLVEATTTNAYIDEVFELIQDLQKSDRQLRRKAIWELAKTGDSRSIEPLIDIIPVVNSVDKSLVLSAISQIAYRSFEPIYDVLFESLKDVDSNMRKDAIRDITALHASTSKITHYLNLMLEDSDKEVRQTATWALKRINLGYIPQLEKYTPNQAISTNDKSKQN